MDKTWQGRYVQAMEDPFWHVLHNTHESSQHIVFGRHFPNARCGKTSQELLPLKAPYGSLNKE